MAKMAARYGHFGMDELRGVVEAISAAEIAPTSRQLSPQFETTGGTASLN